MYAPNGNRKSANRSQPISGSPAWSKNGSTSVSNTQNSGCRLPNRTDQGRLEVGTLKRVTLELEMRSTGAPGIETPRTVAATAAVSSGSTDWIVPFLLLVWLA